MKSPANENNIANVTGHGMRNVPAMVNVSNGHAIRYFTRKSGRKRLKSDAGKKYAMTITVKMITVMDTCLLLLTSSIAVLS